MIGANFDKLVGNQLVTKTLIRYREEDYISVLRRKLVANGLDLHLISNFHISVFEPVEILLKDLY